MNTITSKANKAVYKRLDMLKWKRHKSTSHNNKFPQQHLPTHSPKTKSHRYIKNNAYATGWFPQQKGTKVTVIQSYVHRL